jgi:tetratricopeptide (TPR) repeat protein
MTDMGTMYLAVGDSAKAVEIYQRVLAKDPKFFQAQFNLGLAYRAARDVEQATVALQKAREIAPDEQSRQFLDQLLARGVELPPEKPADVVPPQANAAVAEQDVAPGGFRGGVESIFRGHSIIGPRLEAVEWPDDQKARVLLRGFPMDQMPEDMREMFAERIRGELKEKKAQNQVTAAVQVELVDADSGQVMDAITE